MRLNTKEHTSIWSQYEKNKSKQFSVKWIKFSVHREYINNYDLKEILRLDLKQTG